MSRIYRFIFIELVLVLILGGVAWYYLWPGSVATVRPGEPLVVQPAAPVSGPASGNIAATLVVPEGQLVEVPSGQEVMVLDRIVEGDTLRYRFVAPALAEGSVGDEAASDMQALCDGYALANLPDPDNVPLQVVITLAESEVEFGDSRPDVVQFFEAYRIEDGACVWEMY